MESKMINRDQVEGVANQSIGKAANQSIGKAKETLGHGVGSEQLAVEGLAQQYRGGVQKAVGDVKEGGKDVYDAAKDAAKQR
jgi:uncharacterized protein YjbJ (UPF0337 family)